jgi:DNA repair protein RadC
VGTRKEDVLAMAKRTLQEYGERAAFSHTNPGELASSLDIPMAKACQLVAAFELGRRAYAISRTGYPVEIRTPQQAYEYFRSMGAHSKEQLRGLYLGSRHQVVHEEVVSIGSLTSNIVHPREVFQPAVEYGAVAVIVAHNHPSGKLDPSDADIEATRQLRAAGKILGIDLLDHLIITTESYHSILEDI